LDEIDQERRAILNLARKNKLYIVQQLTLYADAFYHRFPWDRAEQKFIKCAQNHGKLEINQDWFTECEQEWMDAFFYMALFLHKQGKI
jgi:hypothetical protein